MAVVAAAEQLAELGPGVEGGHRGVRGDEALAVVADELQQVELLLIVDRHVAMAEEEDGVGHPQVRPAAGRLAGGALRLHRGDVRIGADEGVVDARVVAEPLDHRQRVRHRVVLLDAVAGVGPGQHHLAGPRPSRRTAGRAAAPPAPPESRRAGAGRDPAGQRPRGRGQPRNDEQSHHSARHHQNSNFSANCMMRGSPAVWIWPKAPLFSAVIGAPRFT